MTAQTVKMFGVEPVVALLSYNNFGSSPFPQAKKVSQAVQLFAPDVPQPYCRWPCSIGLCPQQ